MSRKLEVRVPPIGDFSNVPVIEVLVSKGDRVEREQSLVTLESDKATMEIPSPEAGEVAELRVSVGDTVSEGTVIAVLDLLESASAGRSGQDHEREVADQAVSAEPDQPNAEGEPAAPVGNTKEEPLPAPQKRDHTYDVLVLGSGPGGYTAAFRAADLGLKVALVERYAQLGGVCLNVGCIPSKALLHTARVMDEAAAMAEQGVHFGEPEIDLARLRAFKDRVVAKLEGGLSGMAGKRGVDVHRGVAQFAGPHELEVTNGGESRRLDFAHAIIAVGSRSMELRNFPWGDPRLVDSTGALMLEDIPGRLLVVGGGIIGLEMACVYEALGSRITVVELTAQLMPGTDPDLVRPLQARISKRYENIFLETRVTQVDVTDDALVAHFKGANAPQTDRFDKVLVAVGRIPNGKQIGAEAAGVKVTSRGFIEVDAQMRTNVPHIFAIGDVVGEPMLAHKATHEGKVAAEVIAGGKVAFEARVIPSVAYTDPEVAWAGVTEMEAREAKLAFEVSRFPLAASGRALGMDRTEGFTKLLFDPSTKRMIGAGIVGPHAGDLISECALAIEMGCEAADIALTIHPHPTLSESIGMAAEAFEGTITDLYLPRRKQ